MQRGPRSGATGLIMFPQAILFDLDDTLFDHRRASSVALDAMHRSFAADLPQQEFAARHAQLLELFHTRFLAGELTLDQARTARMQALFGSFEREIDAATAGQAASVYRQQHQSNRHLVDGARALLEQLAGRSRLGIVTNNSTVEQMEKLRALDIASYFDAVVISEDVGVTKPDPEIFAIALQRLGASPHEAVFIGDSWTNDIIGARAVGMTAVWLDRGDQTPALERLPGQKWPGRRSSAGVSPSGVSVITSLAPVESAIDAIRTAFAYKTDNRTPGAEKHEQMETLAR